MTYYSNKTIVYFKVALFGLVAVAYLVLLSCSDDNPIGSTKTKDNSYFPLAVGNHWLYGMEDSFYGDNFSWTVVQMKGDTARVERPWLDVAPQFWPVTIIQDGSDYLIDVDTGWDNFYRFIPDSSWTHRSPYSCDDGLVFKATLDKTTILTPAGSFKNCLKLERQTTSNCSDAGVIYEWWAPGVGLVKWEELNFYAGGPVTGHLISYQLYER